jgi:PBSX family phage terminase large subunit
VPRKYGNNEKNLIPVTNRTKDEAREISKNGGKKSGEVRRAKKTFQEAAKAVIEGKLTSQVITQQMNTLGIPVNKDSTMLDAVVGGLTAKAIKGDVQAFTKLQELCNEGVSDEKYPPVQIPAELMVGAYCDLNRKITKGEVTEAIIKGGRGGWKSSYPGIKIPELIMLNPYMHALCIRNVKDTLKDSVYEQIKWGIERLGVSERFKCTVSPMLITYLPTGQHIYFRGADAPEKIKSIKVPFGYIGCLWFEEFDQYDGIEAIRNIRQSAIRGTDDNGESKAIVFETFNPPKTAQAWANIYAADIIDRQGTEKAKKGAFVLHTTYKDVPKEWLGQNFIDDAEDLLKINPKAYENEYGGIVTGTGGQVFENLEIRQITDEEIKTFDRVRQGLDWGYFPDPTAFVRDYYDRAHQTLYIFAEEKLVKKGVEDRADLLKKYSDVHITADSAEKVSIDYFRNHGYDIAGAIKGPGSVDFGMKWLSSRLKIVIDPIRCPETTKEFRNSEYLKDKDGNFVSGYPDKDNHFQDAVRYSLEEIIMERKYTVGGGISKVR